MRPCFCLVNLKGSKGKEITSSCVFENFPTSFLAHFYQLFGLSFSFLKPLQLSFLIFFTFYLYPAFSSILFSYSSCCLHSSIPPSISVVLFQLSLACLHLSPILSREAASARGVDQNGVLESSEQRRTESSVSPLGRKESNRMCLKHRVAGDGFSGWFQSIGFLGASSEQPEAAMRELQWSSQSESFSKCKACLMWR